MSQRWRKVYIRKRERERKRLHFNPNPLFSIFFHERGNLIPFSENIVNMTLHITDSLKVKLRKKSGLRFFLPAYSQGTRCSSKKLFQQLNAEFFPQFFSFLKCHSCSFNFVAHDWKRNYSINALRHQDFLL